MGYLVELPVAGEVVTVEIEPAVGGPVRARPGRVMARASRSLEEMLAAVRPVAQNFVDGFRGIANPPDEIGVEFGLSLSTEADLMISRTAAQANFKVSLTWRTPPAGAEPA